MSKKGFVLLYISTIAFIVAIFVFYGSIGKQTPGGETQYLGENEISVFQSYQEAETRIYFIELAAQLSAKAASQDNFQADFERKFAEYLEKDDVGVKSADYSFTYQTVSGTMTIIGISSKELVIEQGNLVYREYPNIKVTVPYALQEQAPSQDIFMLA